VNSTCTKHSLCTISIVETYLMYIILRYKKYTCIEATAAVASSYTCKKKKNREKEAYIKKLINNTKLLRQTYWKVVVVGSFARPHVDIVDYKININLSIGEGTHTRYKRISTNKPKKKNHRADNDRTHARITI